jgi:hypothetical protein
MNTVNPVCARKYFDERGSGENRGAGLSAVDSRRV